MNQLTHENIKQLDITTGGGIVSEKTRVDTINHPVLLIGLGGTGTDALLRLKYQINRRFKLPDHPVTKQKKPKPDNIEFLALETNEHDKKRYRGISLDPHTEMVLLSNAGIGSILNNRSTIPEYIKSWLNPALTITDGTKGASGNRQAGRLLLFEKINTAIDAIDNKIRTLRADQENKLLVFILSGLSGGTGGGMFLDVAYIIRGLMEREYGGKGVDKVEIGGYLFTPDVNLSGNNMNIHTEEYIQRNGYAALKELDYWMNLEERFGERFCQKYGTRLEVNSGLAPFNLCHLISASNTDGVLVKGAYDYCMNVTAENIVNFLALEEKESGQEFAVQDYYSNLISNISTMKTNMPEGMPHVANFTYNIIGASAASLPTEELNAYIAYGFFNEIDAMFSSIPDDHDLAQFVQTTGLDIESMGAKIMETLPPIKLDYAATDYYSHQNVIKTGRVNINEKLAELYAQAKRELARTKTLEVMEAIKRELRAIFLNVTQGPIYTSRIIYSDINPCLLARFVTCRQHLKEKIQVITEEIDAMELIAETRLEEARRALFLTKESKKNAFIDAKIKVYQARLQRDVFTALIDIYKQLHTALENENDKVYAPYVEILSEIKKVLAGNASSLCQPVEADTQKQYHWDIINVADAAPEIDDAINAIGREPLLRDFAKMLLAQSAKFLNSNQLNIAAAVSDFVYDQFGEIISRTMGEFLATKYGKERTIESIIEAEIAPRLFKDAKPMFGLDNAAGMFNFPSYGMVSVPWNTPEILRGIEAYQQHALQSLRFNIRKSSITDRIFWLNTQNGIPLFAYTPIKVYEELYERTINTREGVGRHLVMNENESWVNLPSPLPEKLWGDTYHNPRQKQLNEEAGQVFATALENGIINVIDGQFMLGKHPIFTTTIASEAQSHFIRNVRLIGIAKAENAKYEKNAREFAETQSEKSQIDEFLRAIICEAIVKRGAQYIFEKELEDDPWPPFVNLIEEADYPEYAMYKTYTSLTQLQKQIVKQKAKRHEASWLDDRLIISLKKWQGKIAIRKNQLDKEMQKLPNGVRLYDFYQKLLLKLNAQIEG